MGARERAGAQSGRRGTSTLTTRLVLGLVEDRLGEEGVARVLDAVGGPHRAPELRSTTGRVDYATKLAVYDAAADVLDDPRFALDLGGRALLDPAFGGVRSLLHAAGSPGRALRYVSRVSTRFDSAAVFGCESAGPASATLAWRVLPPLHPHRADCDYNVGLLRQVPVVFGLPPAAVRHTVCQLDGAPECRYEMTWVGRRRWSGAWWPRRAERQAPAPVDQVPADQFEARLEALQAAAADVVSGSSVEDVLERIASRANAVLNAPGHVLAVTLPSGEDHVRYVGVATGLGAGLGELRRLDDGLHHVAGHPVVTARIASAARGYGFLAAVALPGQGFFPEDGRALAAYAQHAAASLEMSGHLARAAQEARTAQLLLDVARSLSRHHTVESVARSVAAAVPPLTGATRSAFALLDPRTQAVSIAGMSGWPDDLSRKVARYATGPDESPELCDLLQRTAPIMLDAHSSVWARGMLAEFGVEAMAAIPVVLDGHVLGLVLAHWVTGAPGGLDDLLTERLSGLAGLAAVALDNTRLLEQVRRQALHDALTGCANRLLLEERLNAALDRARRGGTGRVALLFCDVNRFKRVNDSLGHGAGDQLLRHVADALRGSVREGDTVARYSGDEFVVLLPDVHSESQVRDVAARIRCRLAEPLTVVGEQVLVNMAIGSALSDGWTSEDGPRRPETAAALVARADRDMYQLKARTRGLPTPIADGVDRLRLETDLHGAAVRGELVVHYQPQVDVLSGDTVGVEALVRWQHPELGLVPPSVFIPIAEDSGAIDDIGAHVLREACRTVAGWGADGARAMEVSVNVSAAQLHSEGFAELVRTALADAGLCPERLVLEITESQVVADASSATHLRALRKIGVGISVDDFGTGYSSLTQLRRLPATEVKIDRSFTTELPTSAPFVTGIVALAHGLGLRVVAEGVEEPEQLCALREAGCDRAQGYLLGRPAPAVAPARSVA